MDDRGQKEIKSWQILALKKISAFVRLPAHYDSTFLETTSGAAQAKLMWVLAFVL